MSIFRDFSRIYTIPPSGVSEICLMGSFAKLYMRKGFLIYAEMHEYLVIYEKAIFLVAFEPTW
jgi:hypothetical protein